MPNQESEFVGVKFNAGIQMALDIANIIKRCEYFSRIHRYDLWHEELDILQRRIMSKAYDSEKALKEIEDAERGIFNKKPPIPPIDINSMRIWKRKLENNRPINRRLNEMVYLFLSSREVILRKYVDEFGFGNPDAEDYEGL